MIPLAAWASLIAVDLADAQSSPGSEHTLNVDAGWVSLGVGYARGLGAGPISVGVAAGGAWEPATNFEGNVWEPIGLSAFARYRPNEWVHVEAGPLGARYVRADDCSDCGGSLWGIRSAAAVGYRRLFLTPSATFGRAEDELNGKRWGWIWGVQLRLLADFD